MLQGQTENQSYKIRICRNNEFLAYHLAEINPDYDEFFLINPRTWATSSFQNFALGAVLQAFHLLRGRLNREHQITNYEKMLCSLSQEDVVIIWWRTITIEHSMDSQHMRVFHTWVLWQVWWHPDKFECNPDKSFLSVPVKNYNAPWKCQLSCPTFSVLLPPSHVDLWPKRHCRPLRHTLKSLCPGRQDQKAIRTCRNNRCAKHHLGGFWCIIVPRRT